MYRRKMLKETDTRVKLTNQLLSGIRVLKIYAWEAAQEAAIQEARERELRRLKQAIPSRVGMQTLLFAAPVLAAVASFAVYGSVDASGFTAPRIFAAISLFAIMRFPLIFLPFALVEVSIFKLHCNSCLLKTDSGSSRSCHSHRCTAVHQDRKLHPHISIADAVPLSVCSYIDTDMHWKRLCLSRCP